MSTPPGEQQWVGHQVGNFVLMRCIGVGRTACVFEAEDVRLGRRVAIKILSSKVRDVAPLLREARLAAALDHANVVNVLEFGDVDGSQFIAMELLPSQVASLLAERHHLPISTACAIARDAALGLAHAHERGVVHRDIKPSNLLLTSDGRCKVSDFGLAFRGDDDGRRFGFIGTPYYVAPEVIRGGAGEPASDLYGMGATLWHMLTGEPPFSNAPPRAILNMHVRSRLPSITSLRGDITNGLANVVAHLLAKSPADRFANASDLAAALLPYVQSSDVQLRATGVPRQRSTRSRLVAAVLTGALSASVLGGSAYYFLGRTADVEKSEAEMPRFTSAQVRELKDLASSDGEHMVRVVGRVRQIERSDSGRSLRFVFETGSTEDAFGAVCYSELFDDLVRRYGSRFERDLIGRDLQVKGILRIYKDRPRIIVRKVEQLLLSDVRK